MKAIVIVVIGLCLCVAGCVKGLDPNTGETTYRIDPNTAIKIEQGTEGGLSILTIAAAFWPALLPIVGAIGGIYGTWKKIKPKYLEAQSKANLYYSITDSAVRTIEDFKTANPKLWDELESKYWTGIVGIEAENVIRALRSLPAKNV